MQYYTPEWLEMVRKGALIRRYHTINTVGHESVAEHSFGVAMLCLSLTNGGASNDLIKHALFHDLAEQVTGDIPTTSKWANPQLKLALLETEVVFDKQYDLLISLTPDETLIFRWADMLQLLVFCVNQRNLGNKNLDEVFWRGVNYLHSLDHHEVGKRILDYYIKEHENASK